MTLRPCLECGEPAEGSRCDGCAPVAERPRRYPKTSPRARGYDRQWDMLSAQLRRIAVCSGCGTRSGLQGHQPARRVGTRRLRAAACDRASASTYSAVPATAPQVRHPP